MLKRNKIMIISGSILIGINTFFLWLTHFGYLTIPSWVFWDYYVPIMDNLIALENGFLIMGLMGLGLVTEGIMLMKKCQSANQSET